MRLMRLFTRLFTRLQCRLWRAARDSASPDFHCTDIFYRDQCEINIRVEFDTLIAELAKRDIASVAVVFAPVDLDSHRPQVRSDSLHGVGKLLGIPWPRTGR